MLGGKEAWTWADQQQKIWDQLEADTKSARTIQAAINKDASTSKLDELRMQQQIAGVLGGMTQQQKINSDYEIKAEEIRLQYAQKRADLELRIAQIKDPAIQGDLRKQLGSVDSDMQRELDANDRLRSAKMTASYRSIAGEFWNVMIGKGGTFLDYFKNKFLDICGKLFENLMGGVLEGILGKGSGIFGNLFSGGGGGGGDSSGGGGLGGIRGIIKGLFGGGGPATIGSTGMMSEATSTGWGAFGAPGMAAATGAGASAGSFLGVGGKAGAGLQAAAITGGMMAMQDAFHRGGAAGMIEGAAGGAAAGAGIGAMIGTMLGPGVGTALGAAVGAVAGGIAGLVTGLLGGGEAGRQREVQRRADVQSGRAFAESTPLGLNTAYGSTGAADVDTDFMGRTRAIGKGQPSLFAPGSVVISLIDGSQADAAAARFVQIVGSKLLSGGSQFADNVQYVGA